jgi:hypothetical protein
MALSVRQQQCCHALRGLDHWMLKFIIAWLSACLQEGLPAHKLSDPQRNMRADLPCSGGCASGDHYPSQELVHSGNCSARLHYRFLLR